MIRSDMKGKPGEDGGRLAQLGLQVCIVALLVWCWGSLIKKEIAQPVAPVETRLSATRPDHALSPSEQGATSAQTVEDTGEHSPASDSASAPAAEDASPQSTAHAVDPTQEPEQLKALSWSIADAILQHSLADALGLTEAALQAPHSATFLSDVRKLRKDLIELPNLNGLVSEGLAATIGQEIVLPYKGAPRRLIVRAVSVGTISAALVNDKGTVEEGNLVHIKVSTLDPREKLKWIGDADTEARAIMKFMLHREAGNGEQARTYAGKAGLLSESLLACLDAPTAEPSTP